MGLVLAGGEVEGALVAGLLRGGGHLVAQALDLLVEQGVLLLHLLGTRRLLLQLLLRGVPTTWLSDKPGQVELHKVVICADKCHLY